MKVVIGISNRHVHLKKEVWESLFGQIPMEKRNDLGQPGQFATTSTVDISYNGVTIEHVRVIGPIRNYNQIEISASDARVLGVNPPRRQSGDVQGSLPITLIGPKGKVDLESGLILAEMHIHMTPEMANDLNLVDKEPLPVYLGERHLFDAKVKIGDPAALELHIDTDEGKLYNLNTGTEVDVKICGK
ncbi:MAG: PduL/EutD family phosphate acyltransferase [Bacilli bacterium]|nr:PduL/EutD family phosphate acyltransferase [Bacilli bacterium]